MISSDDYFSTYGGGQVYVRRLAEELCNYVILAVLSFSSRVDKGALEVEEQDGVKIFQLHPDAGDEIVQEVLRDFCPDIVHAHGHKARMATLCKLSGIPCVVTAHHGGILCPAGTLLDSHDAICDRTVCHRDCLPCVLRNIRSGDYWYPFMRLLPHNVYQVLGRGLRRVPFIPFLTPIGQAAFSIRHKQEEWTAICDNATVVIAPSDAMADAMLRNGLPQERLRIIPHGVPVGGQVPDGLASLQREIHFFYVGRISYVKGVHVMLAAFSRVSSPDAVLHVIGGAGNAAERRYMRCLQRKYAYDRRIVWHGKVSAEGIPSLIYHWDVMVAPSIYLEVFGLTISEALMQGKPVLATRCGGSEMQITDGRNGWLVPPNSAEALAEKMDYITRKHPVLPMDVPVNTLGQHAQRILKLYEEVTH